jgi:hypothetical protein
MAARLPLRPASDVELALRVGCLQAQNTLTRTGCFMLSRLEISRIGPF